MAQGLQVKMAQRKVHITAVLVEMVYNLVLQGLINTTLEVVGDTVDIFKIQQRGAMEVAGPVVII